MTDTPSISDLADRLAVELRARDGRVHISRHCHEVVFSEQLSGRLDASTPAARHRAYGVLFGCRLAVDRRLCDFDLRQERPEKPGRVFHAHEVPSVYGERLPRLVPILAVKWLEALSGCRVFTTPWHVDGLVFVYLLETGKYLHTLCEEDFDELDLTREKLVRDARHALFYDAYKLKPRQKERTEAGLVRIFRTSEGLGASRAMLLPDFDYDAAREHGCFSTPSRDTMIIGRPAAVDRNEEIFRRVTELTAEHLLEEPFPLSSMVFRLEPGAVLCGEHAGRVIVPAGDEADQEMQPPPDIILQRDGDGVRR
ncbi:MAG: hypothetical protein ACOC9J_01915 [Persicimonas sp.]